MSEPFLAEIRIFPYNAPRGWAACNGQLLPINQNQALFSLLGTTYGGNGTTTFALPNLQGRVPIHFGNGHTIGENGGQQAHTVSMAEMPAHLHSVMARSANADTPIATGNSLASANNVYAAPAGLTPLHSSSVTNVGGSQPHENMQPYLVLNYCIALQGIFPSRN